MRSARARRMSLLSGVGLLLIVRLLVFWRFKEGSTGASGASQKNSPQTVEGSSQSLSRTGGTWRLGKRKSGRWKILLPARKPAPATPEKNDGRTRTPSPEP